MYSNLGITAPAYVFTLKRLGLFFQNVTLFPNVVHHKCNVFMKLVQYNECLISIVGTDDH